MATEGFDLIVIGGGSAGLPAAGFAARLGARVALVEAGRIGGDCTWTGCVPSKALLQAARVAHLMRTAERYGIPATRPVIVDLAAVMATVKAARERVYRTEEPARLREAGIDVVTGAARFLDPHTVEAGGHRLRANRFLVCTGAEPELPPLPGLDGTPHLTYLDVYDLQALPPRLAVLGGGPIGCELAQAFGRLGSRVTLVEAADRLLPLADPAAGGILASTFAAEGIEVRVGTRVEAVDHRTGRVTLRTGAGEIVADALLVATSRRPRTAGLELERAGVALDGAAIAVDSRLRTSQPHIYAAGDVTGSFQFTHYAGWQGFKAVRNALLPGSSAAVRSAVPWAVFTDPEIAQVGELEGEVHEWPLARLDRSQAVGSERGLVRVYSRPGGRIVGALVCLDSAAELINELSVAIESRLKLKDVAAAIHAYPSFGFALQQLAAEATIRDTVGGISGRLLRTFVR